MKADSFQEFTFIKRQYHEIFDFWFFSWISSPSTWVYHYGHFEFFRKFAEIFAAQDAPPVSLTGGKWKKSSSRKILIILLGHLWVVELTYFCLQVPFEVSAAWYCSHYLPPALLTLAANLPPLSATQAELVENFTQVANSPPVSTTQAELVAKFAAGAVDTGGNFATGVVDTCGAPWLANIPRNFRKNDPNVIFMGLGEGDSWKNPETKNLVTLSL